MATVGRMAVTVRRMMAAFGRMVATSKTMVAARTRDVPKPQPEPCHSLEGPLGTLGRLHLCRHESDTKQTKRQKQQKHTYQQHTQVKQQEQQDSAGFSRIQQDSARLSRCRHDCAIELWWTKRNSCQAMAIKARQKLNIERMWIGLASVASVRERGMRASPR